MKHRFFGLIQYSFYQFQKVLVIKRLFVLAVCAVIPWLMLFSLPDHALHIYFFDVGQGDSIFIKTPNNYQILIDGGPDEQVLTELGRVMPFYDRSIDLVFLSHPHADHVTGLIEVLQRFQIGQVLANNVVYKSAEYKTFWEMIEERKIPQQNFLQGDKISIVDGVKLTSFWPQAQTNLFEILDVNRISQITRLKYGDFSVLFTGDAELGLENPDLENFNWAQVDVLKIPHHGSKGAITEKTLQKLRPSLTVISVGPNKFGHPSSEILDLLKNNEVQILRTDEGATIEIVTDSKNWETK